MRVLFVEDDPMNRRVVGDMLSIAEVGMAEAEDGPTGLKMIDEQDYDLILMDLRMPGMDGMTAIRHIRARGDDKATLPILVITADTSLNIRADCLAAGANDVLMKPVAMSELFDSIGRVIAERGSALTLI